MTFGVSVWIPNRNHAETLGAAIYSAAQEMPSEVLVIDDASTDNSVSVMKEAERAYPCVKAVRNSVKAECWEQAAAERVDALRGRHITSLSADDELCSGVVQSTLRHPSAAVVFHHYLVRKPGRDPHGAVSVQVESTTVCHVDAARARQLSNADPCETGIGSAVRWDWQRWLKNLEYWRMGPWADAIGFAAVAVMGGCVYVPHVGAIFTEDDQGYGATRRNGPDAARFMIECWAFLKRANVPEDVAAAICRKRGVS